MCFPHTPFLRKETIMNSITENIIKVDYSLEQNTSLSISNKEYIKLAAGARDYVVGNGKNAYS